MMYQKKVNQLRAIQNERLSRKQRIRDSLQMSQDYYLDNLDKSEEYLPVELRTPTRKMPIKSDDGRILLNKEITDHFRADNNEEREDKPKKKKGSKNPKQRSKSSFIENEEDEGDDDQSISLDQIYEASPAQTHCSLYCSFNEDSLYMSDITDEDEPIDETWGSERKIKRKKAKKERRRSKSGKSLGEFDRSRHSGKDKRRPRSDGNLGDSGGVKKSSRRKKKSRSLDPASRSSNNSISRSFKSESKSQKSASKLRRPRDSMEKSEKARRSRSVDKRKRKGKRSTRRKTLSRCASITSDESPLSESFERVSESIDKFDSTRNLRRPRNSLETSPKSKKERRKPRSEKNRNPSDYGPPSWHTSSLF